MLLAPVTIAMTGETHFTVSLDPSKRLGKGAPITYCTDSHLGTGPVPDPGVLRQGVHTPLPPNKPETINFSKF